MTQTMRTMRTKIGIGIRRLPIWAIHTGTLIYIFIVCQLCSYFGQARVVMANNNIPNLTEDSNIVWREGMKVPENHATEEERIALAITIEGEGKGQESLTELSQIGWIALNRVHSNEYPNDVVSVVTQKKQFGGYRKNGTYSEKSYWVANDVLARYEREIAGETNIGRTIPIEYLYFKGDGEHNYFSIEENGPPYVWSSVQTPYAS